MKKALIGAGGFAREIKAHVGDDIVKCFVDDKYWIENSECIHLLSTFNPAEYEVLVAIADPTDRHDMVQRLPKETKYFTFIHPSVQIMDDNIEVGEGSFIGANSILTTNIKLGKHAILNRGNHIGHDCLIQDYFSAMPGAIISGNVTIGDYVYIGTNASVKEKISIHSSTTIGLNSGVVKHIGESGVYVGTPAKKIK